MIPLIFSLGNREIICANSVSSESENQKHADELGLSFIDKNSKKFPVDLRNIISENFGFGAFVFRNPSTGEEVMRVNDLKEFQDNMFKIPDDSLLYHASRNDISRWLYSRAMFPIAEIIQAHRFRDIKEAPKVKEFFFNLIVKYRRMKNKGIVAIFKKTGSTIIPISPASGKARSGERTRTRVHRFYHKEISDMRQLRRGHGVNPAKRCALHGHFR